MTNFASVAPNLTYTVLNTLQAAGADFVVANRMLKIGNPLKTICEYPLLDPNGATNLQVSVDETLQVTTLTPTAANNSTYSFYIQQYNQVTGQVMTRFYTTTTAASGGTATTIGDAFRSQINQDTSDGVIEITATGTTTLILTAVAGYPVFNVVITATGGGLTQSTGTAGVRSVNTTTDLELQGLTGFTGTNYTKWTLVYGSRQSPMNTTQVFNQFEYDVYINEDAANYAAALAKIKDIMTNTGPGSSTAANPETLALGDS